MSISGKVIAITGASSGIGAATARELAARGACVVLGARRADRLERLVADIEEQGGQALVVRVDVTDADDLQGLVAAAVQGFGRLDVMVANAGVSSIATLANGDLASWSSMIEVNIKGVLHAIAAALPVFAAQGSGHVVTVVSTSGIKIVPGQGVYAGTKNAVRTVMEALRQESTDGRLRTTSVSPGYVRTELVDSIADPATRQAVQQSMADLGIEPAAVARAITFAIDQPDDVEIGDLTIRPTRQS